MNRRHFLAVIGAACGGALTRADPPARHPLMTFPDDSGAWLPVKTPADWARRRRAILAAMQTIMGPLPGAEKRCPLDVQVSEEVDTGTYVRRAITYASEPGSRAPAYLLIPKHLLGKSGAKVPAVLCLHPTDNKIGCKVVVGLGGKEHRQYAAELADRGYVTLAPAYPLLADYQPDLAGLGYVSGTMKAIWDNIRGMDLLDSLPFVQHGNYAAIGHSLGGHNSVYTALFDERIKAVVSSCGLDSYADYKGGDITGWTSTRYMPRLAQFKGRSNETPFDFDEILAALAPRPVMLSAALHDANFSASSVDRIATAARAVYALHGAADALVVEHPDCEHDFPDGARDKAYAFLAGVLRPAMRG
jgi:dienelactone hydrolase